MTARTDYIKHCECLGIHRSLAGLMAKEAAESGYFGNGLSERSKTAAGQYISSFDWHLDDFSDFHSAVHTLLRDMAKIGECK
jgi:hypothetical protein